MGYKREGSLKKNTQTPPRNPESQSEGNNLGEGRGRGGGGGRKAKSLEER